MPTAEPPVTLPLHTDRLTLRAARADDLDQVLTYWGDDAVTRFLPFPSLDRAGATDRLERLIAATDPRRTDDALMLIADLDGRIVGDLMLRFKTGDFAAPDGFGVAEIGWVFHPAHQGVGLATEAARALLGLAFGPYGCHRVEAMLNPLNERSMAMCRRLGMTQEAHLRRDWLDHHGWSDTAIFGLLREEWASAVE